MPLMSVATHKSLPLMAAPKYDPPPPGPAEVHSVGCAKSRRDSRAAMTAAAASFDRARMCWIPFRLPDLQQYVEKVVFGLECLDQCWAWYFRAARQRDRALRNRRGRHRCLRLAVVGVDEEIII